MKLSVVENVQTLSAEVDRADLIRAVTNACQIAAKPKKKAERSSVTEYVVIRRSGNGISVSATDFDVVSSTFARGYAPDSFLVAVQAGQLLTCLKNTTADRIVTITPNETGALIEIGSSTFNMKCGFDPADYPMEHKFQEGLAESNQSFVLETKVLQPILHRCRLAMSKDPTRYYLAGVLFSARNNQLVVVSTDGHRLVKYVGDLPAGAGDMPDTIVPTATVNELYRLLNRKDAPEQTMVTVSGNAISFLVGEDELLESKTVDGTYPDFDRVIPSDPEQIVSFDPQSMIDAVNAVGSLNPSDKKLAISIHENGIDISMGSAASGEAKCTLAAQLDGVTPVTVGFNRVYLKEFMNTFERRARMAADQNNGPIWFQDTDDPRFTYVLMPMKV